MVAGRRGPRFSGVHRFSRSGEMLERRSILVQQTGPVDEHRRVMKARAKFRDRRVEIDASSRGSAP